MKKLESKYVFVINYYGSKTKEVKVVDFYNHGKYISYRTEDGIITSVLNKKVKTISLI